MTIAIVESRNLDIDEVLKRSPEARANPETPTVLRRLLKTSEEVWLGLHDGKVACVWGLVPPSAISNRAHLWLLTTDLVEQHKFIFIRHSQLIVENALKRHEVIVGHVKVGNSAARKWLRWLGAEIDTPERGYSPFKIRRK